MTGPALLASVKVLETSSASCVIADLCRELTAMTGAEVRVWLVEYRQRFLRLVDQPDVEELVDGSIVGRCYAGQVTLRRTDETGDTLLVPVSTRGNRHGVLEVRWDSPDQHDGEIESELETLAPLLAQALEALGTVSGDLERVRRRRPMTVAAELQWSLLPGTAYRDANVTIAAMLEPAYSVAGDAYDWTREGDVLNLALVDGVGRGVPAALATTLALGALRNARSAGVVLADQAALGDQAVYAHHGGESFVAALLVQLDLAHGTARVVDAGSPQLYRIREGRTSLIELEAQLPLGMFEETRYVEQEVDLAPGDRIVIVSDGVHASTAKDGSGYDSTLASTFRDCRLLSPAETVRHIVRDLHAQVEGRTEDGLADDAMILVLDWHPA